MKNKSHTDKDKSDRISKKRRKIHRKESELLGLDSNLSVSSVPLLTIPTTPSSSSSSTTTNPTTSTNFDKCK